ncbi:MAG: hypothetical protein QMD20_05840, partial [Candidatus Bathyarchaeia archaeon]|nr:hypothetical protein [Candidatus Bathyarchaeia archaeon]
FCVGGYSASKSLAVAQHLKESINLLLMLEALAEKGGKQIVRSWPPRIRIHIKQNLGETA